MRVLLTTDTIGGVWTYTQELTRGLLERGCSVALVSFGRWPSQAQLQWSLQLTVDAQSQFFFVPSEIPLEWMPDNSMVLEQGAALIHSVIRDFRPDLLHSNQFCFGQLTLDIPKLLVAHSDVLSWADACVPEGLELSPWLARYMDLVQKGLGSANALVAPTFHMMSALSRHFVLPSLQKIISNGRSIRMTDPSAKRIRQAVTAGRLWDPSKNLALVQQIQSFPIMIVGDTDGQSIASGCHSAIHHLGFLPEHKLFHLFRQSQIYIAASLYEPFGLAPLEAALCGCAVVANDIPSLREVWGPAALYFRTAHDLQRQLERVSSDVVLLAEAQSRAFARARRYTARAMTYRYLTLYEKLIPGLRKLSDRPVSSLTHVH